MNSRSFLTRFGFKFNKNSTHIRRTMMFGELSLLLTYVSNRKAKKSEYIRAIKEDNCLGKRSVQNRKLTAQYLTELYGLDPSLAVFRTLLYFWDRDEQSRPLLAFLCAYTRDQLLRLSMPFIFDHQEGEAVDRFLLEAYIEEHFPGRFSKNTLSSISRNVNSSWTQSGHLRGYLKKYRAKIISTPGATAYALFLAYLTGGRGKSLLASEYVRLLDSPEDRLLMLAAGASQRGWMVCNHIDDVLEVRFPNLLTDVEMEWSHEQNRALT